MIVYLLIVFYTFLGSLGALFLKKSTKNLKKILLSCYFYIGGLFYVLGALGSIIALRILPYGIVYSMSGLTYLWTSLLGLFYLKEELTKRKFIGSLCILLGVILINYK